MRVLLIEDSKRLVESLKRGLCKEGFAVDSAYDGEDGRAVLEILLAAYASAGRGCKVELPFASDVRRPVELWKQI